MNNKWSYQYLEDESLYYLTEHDSEMGVVSELFFNTLLELDEYVTLYNIPVLVHENAQIQEVGSYLSDLGLANLDINIFHKSNNKKYKSNHSITLEMIKQIDAEDLGQYLKNMVRNLEDKINE